MKKSHAKTALSAILSNLYSTDTPLMSEATVRTDDRLISKAVTIFRKQ